MRFNFKQFRRHLYIALFESDKYGVGMNPTRIFLIALFGFVGVPLMWASSRLMWAFDEILFRGYRKQNVDNPIFIVGNPRSGTTFMHRLLARDASQFAHIRTWEMVFAPSVTQRKFYGMLGNIDRAIGSPFIRILKHFDEATFGQVDYHKAGLWRAEEDEVLLLYAWDSTFQLAVFPYPDEVLRPLLEFDKRPRRRRRVMTFYKNALKRHMFVRQKNDEIFLSKNPVFSSRVDALAETFPESKFIYMVRSPLDVLGSVASAAQTVWRDFQGADEPFPFYDIMWDALHMWYRYTLEWIDNAPEDRVMIVNFDDLTRDPKATVEGIYAHFGLEMSEAYQNILIEETAKARSYKSTHDYSLADTPFTYERIMDEYKDLFDRFGFDRQEHLQADTGNSVQTIS